MSPVYKQIFHKRNPYEFLGPRSGDNTSPLLLNSFFILKEMLMRKMRDCEAKRTLSVNIVDIIILSHGVHDSSTFILLLRWLQTKNRIKFVCFSIDVLNVFTFCVNFLDSKCVYKNFLTEKSQKLAVKMTLIYVTDCMKSLLAMHVGERVLCTVPKFFVYFCVDLRGREALHYE